MKNDIKQSEEIMELLQTHVQKSLPVSTEMQSAIATNKTTLLRYPTLLDALIESILHSFVETKQIIV